MKPVQFSDLAESYGTIEKYTVGQVFHAQDFPNKLFLLKKGYVKRYQVTNPDQKVIELIYGPDHIISLSQLYNKLFGVNQNNNRFVYVYQAMTDVEMRSVGADIVLAELDKDPLLYRDFFYESGLKLRSNIFRLASNAIKGDEKKIAHQIICLAYEFAGLTDGDIRKAVELPLPQSTADIAEQLNISEQVTQSALNGFVADGLIKINSDTITILDIELLKDVYL